MCISLQAQSTNPAEDRHRAQRPTQPLVQSQSNYSTISSGSQSGLVNNQR